MRLTPDVALQKAPTTRPADGGATRPKPSSPRTVDTLGALMSPVRLSSPQSRIHFVVHPGMEELQRFAREKGWVQSGFNHLSIPWQELVFTTDNWKTTRSLKSTDVPSPVVNGFFNLPNVEKGTVVEFAIHVGLACHAPTDVAGYRERSDLWLNNGGRNFTQVSQ